MIFIELHTKEQMYGNYANDVAAIPWFWGVAGIGERKRPPNGCQLRALSEKEQAERGAKWKIGQADKELYVAMSAIDYEGGANAYASSQGCIC